MTLFALFVFFFFSSSFSLVAASPLTHRLLLTFEAPQNHPLSFAEVKTGSDNLAAAVATALHSSQAEGVEACVQGGRCYALAEATPSDAAAPADDESVFAPVDEEQLQASAWDIAVDAAVPPDLSNAAMVTLLFDAGPSLASALRPASLTFAFVAVTPLDTPQPEAQPPPPPFYDILGRWGEISTGGVAGLFLLALCPAAVCVVILVACFVARKRDSKEEECSADTEEDAEDDEVVDVKVWSLRSMADLGRSASTMPYGEEKEDSHIDVDVNVASWASMPYGNDNDIPELGCTGRPLIFETEFDSVPISPYSDDTYASKPPVTPSPRQEAAAAPAAPTSCQEDDDMLV